MQECDVVIPVYKSPEWVELCLFALFHNTKEDTLRKVFLINDSDDEFTKNCLKNLKNKYGNKIVIKQNKKNLGFTGTANNGLKLSKANYVLLLNTDCLISKNTIEKLIAHMERDKKIGLICPISSNAANLSLDMLEGFTYTQMDELLEQRFLGKTFDACTVVGNCLMISRECINKVGYLDEIYAPGYGEETDYQFKAMKEGFSAKIAIDTYVFHKAETSFGISEEKQKMIKEHLDIFFSRWKEDYDREMEKYKKNDPVKYILSSFKENPPKINNLAVFYVLRLGRSGGCNVIVDIINRLAIMGYQCNILYEDLAEYPETLLFNPVSTKKIDKISSHKIIATLWVTIFLAKKIATAKKWELVYFVQGLEQHFENGRNYGAVEVSYKLADKIVTISNTLKLWLKNNYNMDSKLIQNGINLELLKKINTNKSNKNILLISRGDYRKCDYVLFDILRKIDNDLSNVSVRIVMSDKEYMLPLLCNKKNKYEIIDGPLDRVKIYELLQKSDIYVDTSYSEGFGLTALEAMAAGCIPIVSDSFGVRDYLINKKNGLVVKEVNDADVYLEKIKMLLEDGEYANKLRLNMEKTINKFDFNSRLDDYRSVLCEKNNIIKKLTLDTKEKEINEKILSIFDVNKEEPINKPHYSKKQVVIRKVAKVVPRSIKKRFIVFLEYLRACY